MSLVSSDCRMSGQTKPYVLHITIHAHSPDASSRDTESAAMPRCRRDPPPFCGHISSLGDVERSRFRRCRSNGRPQKKSPAGIRRGSHLVTETNRETCDRLLSRCRCLYTRSITACQVDVIAPVDKVETSRGTVSARLRRGGPPGRAWKETPKRLSGRWRGDIVPTRRASFDSDPREKST